MKYKAKASYKRAKVNYNTLGSPAKHQRLLNGDWVEITEPEKDIIKHLIKEK